MNCFFMRYFEDVFEGAGTFIVNQSQCKLLNLIKKTVYGLKAEHSLQRTIPTILRFTKIIKITRRNFLYMWDNYLL